MKGDRGTPLVREGNIFLWGFSGAPARMTEPGKAALVNAIAYMKQFDGQAPTRRAGVRERSRWVGVLDSQYVKPSRLHTYFGPELVAAHGADKNAYRATLQEVTPYLYVPRGTATWSVDEDARALGHANTSLDLIHAALEMGGPRGQRILDRYWPEDDLVVARPKTTAELAGLQKQLVFSETHGYRWLSRPPLAGPQAWEVHDALATVKIPEPTDFAPVSFGARLVGGYNAEALAYDQRLGLVTLAIRAELLEGWHVTIDGRDTFMPPVTIDVDLPAGMEWHDDDFELNGKTYEADGALMSHGPLVWTRRIWLRDTRAGTHQVNGKVEFQACDESTCLPPAEFEFAASVKVR